MKLHVVPITVKSAQRYVKRWHRHLPEVQGGLFAVAVASEGEICGVAIVGRPARMAQDGWTCCVTRCATDGTANACSMLYQRCRRVAQLLGYRRVLTFTREDESGVSLLAMAAKAEAELDPQTWNRPSRARKETEMVGRTRWNLTP
jgi:hypothetical protein